MYSQLITWTDKIEELISKNPSLYWDILAIRTALLLTVDDTLKPITTDSYVNLFEQLGEEDILHTISWFEITFVNGKKY